MKILTNYDFNKNEIQNAAIHNLATAPTTTKEGQVYFNTTDHKQYIWNGTLWVVYDGHTHSNTSVLDNTTASYTSEEKTKLAEIATGANKYVHPTSDGNLHVPATSTTNNGKVLQAGSTAGSLSWHALVKADVGLGSVDNTADSDKPVSTAQSTAINNAITTAQTYTNTAISNLVGSAPTTLNTLQELADALADDASYATTISTALALRTKKYAADIGDGTNTTFTKTHSLATLDVVVMLVEKSTGSQVFADVQLTDTNNVKITFAVAPTTNQYRVVVVG